MTTSFYAIRVVVPVDNAAEGEILLQAYMEKPQCLGGRVFPPAEKGGRWRLAVFYSAECFDPKTMHLAKNATRVLIMPAQREALGIIPDADELGVMVVEDGAQAHG